MTFQAMPAAQGVSLRLALVHGQDCTSYRRQQSVLPLQ